MQPIQQNGNIKVLAQWVLETDVFQKRYQIPILIGMPFVDIVLLTENLWSYYFSISVSDLKDTKLPSYALMQLGSDCAIYNSIRDDILYKRLGPPTFGAYPNESIQTGCQCSSRDIFNFGCPSARGQKCRSI